MLPVKRSGVDPQVYKYVDQKGLAAMLPVKRSVGVDPEVNLTNSLHTGENAHMTGIYHDFETIGRCHQKSKPGVSAVPQKGLMFSNFFPKVCIVSKIAP